MGVGAPVVGDVVSMGVGFSVNIKKKYVCFTT
jgi:hypothetical protein